jgi:glycosyltransferase involved in cell wall biosynthesis
LSFSNGENNPDARPPGGHQVFFFQDGIEMISDSTPPPQPDAPYRIAIDARSFCFSPCGYTIYIRSVIVSMRQAGFEVVLLSNIPLRLEYPETAGLETIIFGGKSWLRWEQIDLPRYMAGANFDVYFAGMNRGIPLRKCSGTRYVLGLLDMIPLIFPRMYFIGDRGLLNPDPAPAVFKNVVSMGLSAAMADSILTISEASARDIRRLTRRRNVQTCPIRLQDTPVPLGGPPAREFCYVGGEERSKLTGSLLAGFARLIESPEAADCRLVIIGGHEFEKTREIARRLGLEGKVEFTGWIEDDEKFRVIGRSLALVYPSLYEGYGLAIAEGLQAGVPVIAGRGGSQSEVGGDAVCYVDPTNPLEIAEAMREMLDDETRRQWVERGRERIRYLTDDRICRELVEYFRRQAGLARAVRNRRSGTPKPASV